MVPPFNKHRDAHGCHPPRADALIAESQQAFLEEEDGGDLTPSEGEDEDESEQKTLRME